MTSRRLSVFLPCSIISGSAVRMLQRSCLATSPSSQQRTPTASTGSCTGPGSAVSSASPRPEGPLWRPREDYALSLLTAEELPIWHAARDKAAEDRVLMTSWPFHCVVGTKPL
jgi:hypothetical protein